jgi:CheY-like chemotaxis protein
VQLNAGRHHIDADPARVQQIIWNLMRNAIKFTPSGGAVMLRTRNAHDNGQENPPLIIEVSDTGVGIPQERLERIFSPFEQGALEVTRKFGGLGLGLAISRALAELHDGTISAYSAGEGQGSTFTVQLPTIPASAAVRAVTPPLPPTAVRPLRILIVEDHESTARTLAQLLRSSGHEVEVAGMLGEAMDLANTHVFDLVISDLGLPDGSGLELMRQLRSRPNLRGIALSGYGMEEDVRKSLEAGFQEHLTKPLNIHAVESAVARVMK